MTGLDDRSAFQRQRTEESLAARYVRDLQSAAKESAETEEEREPELPAITDDNWATIGGVTYTPDYARGSIQCVLCIPSVGINRGVYGDSFDDIYYNLDIWMPVPARPDYKLGRTHYVIYGHNHTTQNLSFNRLADVACGDWFTLTSPRGVFTYRVTAVYAEWREAVAREIADNFSLPKEKCYIVTCGRGAYRYRDLVVEGTMTRDGNRREK